MGTPKPLLLWKGQSLIENAVAKTREAGIEKIVIVAGAHFDLVSPILRLLKLPYARNEDWKKGMGSSIRSGLQKLLEVEAAIEGALIWLCDQPLVNSADLRALIEAFDPPQFPIAAAEFSGTQGIPTVFGREFFDVLLQMEESAGAKSILTRNLAKVRKVPIPEAASDIDTPEDYRRLVEAHRAKLP
jgi:molybdenum cofactor cytidylyltransferase